MADRAGDDVTDTRTIPCREFSMLAIECGHPGCGWDAEGVATQRPQLLDMYAAHEERDHGVRD